MTIYLRLRELRLALGLTQAELARLARVRRATVSRLENSRVGAINLTVLEQVAEIVGVEPGALLTRTRPEPRAALARRRPLLLNWLALLPGHAVPYPPTCPEDPG